MASTSEQLRDKMEQGENRMNEEKFFIIGAKNLQLVIDYLGKHPYVEVHQLIPIFFNLKEGIEKPDKPDKG